MDRQVAFDHEAAFLLKGFCSGSRMAIVLAGF